MIPEKLEAHPETALDDRDEPRCFLKVGKSILYLDSEVGFEIVRRYNGYADQQKLIEQLVEALNDYGEHNAGCSYPYGEKYGCRCGWLSTKNKIDDALAATRKE